MKLEIGDINFHIKFLEKRHSNNEKNIYDSNIKNDTIDKCLQLSETKFHNILHSCNQVHIKKFENLAHGKNC